ncbi:MAG TPA: hypothetical protein VHZ56_09505 [Devosia sp.]|nr:hypothetical protein [Devosia sp.]
MLSKAAIAILPALLAAWTASAAASPGYPLDPIGPSEPTACAALYQQYTALGHGLVAAGRDAGDRAWNILRGADTSSTPAADKLYGDAREAFAGATQTLADGASARQRCLRQVNAFRAAHAGSPGLLGGPADARILHLAGNALDLLRRNSDGAANVPAAGALTILGAYADLAGARATLLGSALDAGPLPVGRSSGTLVGGTLAAIVEIDRAASDRLADAQDAAFANADDDFSARVLVAADHRGTLLSTEPKSPDGGNPIGANALVALAIAANFNADHAAAALHELGSDAPPPPAAPDAGLAEAQCGQLAARIATDQQAILALEINLATASLPGGADRQRLEAVRQQNQALYDGGCP